MFKYNFRDYDKAEIKPGHRRGARRPRSGLIAMKTQASGISFEERIRQFESTHFTRGQAVLKAVWEDERIAAAVSHMDTIEKVRENIAAAARRHRALRGRPARAADARRGHPPPVLRRLRAHLQPGRAGAVRIGATLRYLMYHDVYGDVATARAHFAPAPEGGAGRLPTSTIRQRPPSAEPRRHSRPHGRARRRFSA